MKKKTTNLPVVQHQLSVIDGTKAYIELKKQVTEHGILKRSYGFYSFTAAITLLGFVFSTYMIFITPLSLPLVFWCLVLSFFTVQCGGLMHDAGHKAIANSVKMNAVLGIIFGSIIARDYDAWTFSHNKHHAHTNQEDEDPDLDLPLHAFTQRQYAKQKGIWRLLRKYQVYTYYFLRMLAVDAQRFAALQYFIYEQQLGKFWGVFIWGIGIFFWFLLPFLIFAFPKALIVFLVTHAATGFYFANLFAPNHKGMPELPKDAKISFLEHQIMTSRNIYGHWLTDYVFMGLNYQIEHHLFPNCPRNKLNKITPFVLDICRKMQLEYTQVSVLESNRIILATLHEVALSAENEK